MKRFVIMAAVAAGLGLGLPGKADAQILFGFSDPRGSGMTPSMTPSMTTGRTFVTPDVINSRMFSPFPRGAMIQPSFRSFGFNQFNGMGFRNNFFTPNQFLQPRGFGTPFNGFGMNGGFMGRGHR